MHYASSKFVMFPYIKATIMHFLSPTSMASSITENADKRYKKRVMLVTDHSPPATVIECMRVRNIRASTFLFFFQRMYHLEQMGILVQFSLCIRQSMTRRMQFYMQNTNFCILQAKNYRMKKIYWEKKKEEFSTNTALNNAKTARLV